ncbi:MAG: single-stranded DNA-binding protein, partial [bacterium]
TWKEKASGERKQRTEWHRVVCFGRLAEIVSEYLTKGSYVFFEGRMQTRQYTDRDNTERSITEVIASDMRILDARNGNEGEEPLTGPSMTRYRYERRNRTRDKRWNDPSPAAGVEEGTGRRAVRALA